MDKPQAKQAAQLDLSTDVAKAAGENLAALVYHVCKDGSVVFPPNKCPENAQKYLPQMFFKTSS
jgi:hypothetical protein